MTLDAIDWKRITPAEAALLTGAAGRRKGAAAARFNETGAVADEDAWLRAFTVWEDLHVLALGGERPAWRVKA